MVNAPGLQTIIQALQYDVGSLVRSNWTTNEKSGRKINVATEHKWELGNRYEQGLRRPTVTDDHFRDYQMSTVPGDSQCDLF